MEAPKENRYKPELKKVPQEKVLMWCTIIVCVLSIILIISASIACYKFINHDK